MLKFLLLLALICAPAAPTPTASVTVLGDSVIVVATVADNVAPQPVAVDSVELFIDVTVIGANPPNTNILARRVAKASPTVVRFAYPLSMWAPNQTRSGRVCAALGRVNPEGGIAGLWSGYTCAGPAAWTYTRNLTPPNAPEAGTVTATTAALN